MKKLVMVVLTSALLLTFLASLPLHASASSTVGTYTVADLGQGAWVGGSLNADGTLGGGGSYSLENGSLVGTVAPTTWSFVKGGQAVSLCFLVQPIEGPPPFPSICVVVPVTGTPVVIDGTLFRITLNA